VHLVQCSSWAWDWAWPGELDSMDCSRKKIPTLAEHTPAGLPSQQKAADAGAVAGLAAAAAHTPAVEHTPAGLLAGTAAGVAGTVVGIGTVAGQRILQGCIAGELAAATTVAAAAVGHSHLDTAALALRCRRIASGHFVVRRTNYC